MPDFEETQQDEVIFALDNNGEIWTFNHKVDGQYTDSFSRYGRPEEATHLIYDLEQCYSYYVAVTPANAPIDKVLKALGLR